MPALQTELYNLPEHWLVALMYDDVSGLDEADELALDRFLADGLKKHDSFWCLGTLEDGAESHFQSYHDVRKYGVLPCQVVTVMFDVGDKG